MTVPEAVVAAHTATVEPATATPTASTQVGASTPLFAIPPRSAVPVVPPIIQKIDAQTQSGVRTVFNGLINWVSTLPVNDVTTWMEGALLTVRRSLFNQTPSVNAFQTTSTSESIKGRIDVIDQEADDYTIALVESPSHGTVTLATTSQAEGRGVTKYTYTPGADYAGQDQFVVKVKAAGGFNLFHPFGLLDTRYYTVKVGDGAVTHTALGAEAKDALNTSLYLGNAGATVTVKKQGLLSPKYTATVTLSAASAARSFDWMDARGRKGSVPVAEMLTKNWESYSAKAAENGVKPLLMFSYRDKGVDNVVFVDVDKVTKNADGSFKLTGELSPEAPAQAGRVDRADFTGINYERAYHTFLNANGFKDCKSGAECTTVTTTGTLGTTILSPSAFRQDGGHDYPVAITVDQASATQTSPGLMGPGTTSVNQGNGSSNSGNTNSSTAQLSAMVPWGNTGSFITATNLATGDDLNNGVYLYTVNAPTGGGSSPAPTYGEPIELAGSGWNSQVNVMTTYTQVLTDDYGNPIPQIFAGTVTPMNVSSVYTVTGSIGASNTAPASFNGYINGTTMTVTNVAGGTIGVNTYVVGGPANNTEILAQTSGTPGGAGTYTVSESQTFGVPQMVAGLGGTTLYIPNLASTWPANAPAPEQLPGLGATVTGTGVAPNTTITGYSGGNAFTVNYFNLVAPSDLTISWDAEGLTGSYQAAQASISASVGIPVTFTGYIDGNTLTVYDAAGAIALGDAVVGGPANNTQIVAQNSGTPGGAGTYTVNVSQNFGASGPMPAPLLIAGNGGSTLQLAVGSLPAGVDPSSLVGLAVVGTNVAPGTTIRSYSGTSGGTATYTVNTYNLTGAGTPLTVAVATGTTQLTLTVPNTVNPGMLVGQTISGQGVTPGTSITGFVAEANATPGTYTYTVNNPIYSAANTITITTPNLYETQTGLLVGLADGSVQYWNGLGCSQTTSGCTGAANPNGQANYGGGWTQLIASNSAGWGEDNPVNTIVTLPNNLGFMVGLGNGSVQLWNSTILPDGTIVPGEGAPSSCSTNSAQSCWIQKQDGGWSSAVNAMIPSGQNGGVVVGLADGSVQQLGAWNDTSWTQLQGTGWANSVNTLMPYDGTTFIGGISGTPVVTSGGSITAPSYTVNSPALAAESAACPTSYTSGAGIGCGGYVLTVQSVSGQPLRVGQTLYGGAGLVAGTTITAQISDGAGNLCADSCSEGGAGVYFVNTPQLVAPGSPMSASDGTRFVVGLGGGAVEQYTGSGWNQLQGNGWSSAVNTMIPWRDGLVVGLNNGAVEYWNPGAQSYPGAFTSGWNQLQGTGWDNAVTSMVPLGDGFAVGLTATTGSQNGTVQYYTGWGPASTTNAFGAGPGYYTENGAPYYPTIMGYPYKGNAWAQIAGPNALSGNSASGSIQQLIPLSAYTSTSSGIVLAQSLIAGQTNNGIYSWTGSTQTPYPSNIGNTGSAWQMIQASDSGSKPVLTGTQLLNAWNWVTSAGLPSFSSSFGPGGVGDPVNDPVFGLTNNQAWCGSSCTGDYYSFSFNYQPGDNGVIYSWPPNESAGIQADVNLQLAGYGYIFVPNGIWDKFHPDDYSLGMVLAAAGGPSLELTLPSVSYGPVSTTIPVFSKVEPIDAGLAGIVTLNSGITISASAGADITPDVPITLAAASFIPGILLTWNVAGYQNNLAMTGAFTDQFTVADPVQIFEDVSDPSATASLTIQPSLNINWGYTIPESVPVVGGDGLINLGMGYSNPVTLTATAQDLNLDDPNVQLQIDAAGLLNFSAALLPGITSSLSWNENITLYNYSDYLPPITL